MLIPASRWAWDRPRAGGDLTPSSDAPGQIKVESNADPSAGPWGTTFTISVSRTRNGGPAGGDLGATATAFAVPVTTTANTD